MAEGGVGALPPCLRVWGRVLSSDGAALRLGGLGGIAAIGDGLSVERPGLEALSGEVIAVDRRSVTGLLAGPAHGLAAGTRAWLLPAAAPAPSDGWLGRVLDAGGCDAEGRRAPEGRVPVSLRAAPPPAARRRGLGARVATGLAATDTVLPLCRGQRIGLFAGSGVGKSSLLAALARGIEADVVVIGLIGERGREVGEFVRDKLGARGMARSVVIAATSDRSALEKRRAALLSVAVAEHFRDRGRHVLLLLDSLTRFAEAHREIALAAGEAPALRAYPPSTAAEIAGLCERAGPGASRSGQGDITAVFSVLVAGSDMEEPVADMVRGTLDGHIVLSREIAERGRFPAIDIRRSVSRSAPASWEAAEGAMATRLRALVSAYEEAAPMIQAGLYQPGGDAVLDEAVALWPRLDGFLAESTEGEGIAAARERLAAALAPVDEGAPGQPIKA